MRLKEKISRINPELWSYRCLIFLPCVLKFLLNYKILFLCIPFYIYEICRLNSRERNFVGYIKGIKYLKHEWNIITKLQEWCNKFVSLFNYIYFISVSWYLRELFIYNQIFAQIKTENKYGKKKRKLYMILFGVKSSFVMWMQIFYFAFYL